MLQSFHDIFLYFFVISATSLVNFQMVFLFYGFICLFIICQLKGLFAKVYVSALVA